MNNGVLIAFGLVWMVVSAFVGLFLGAKHVTHLDALEVAAKRGDLVAFHATFESYKWRSSVHAHGMLFALSSIVVGVILPNTGYGATMSEVLVGLLIGATVIWTLSSFKRIRPLMGLADIVFVIAISITAWGIANNT